MRVRTALPFAAACFALAGCIPAGATPAWGRPVASPTGEGWTGRAELLAVTPDTIWVWKEGVGLVPFPTALIGRVTVEKHRYGAGMTLKVVAVTGVASGLALTAACSTVADADCGAVLPLWMFANLAVGAVIAIPLHFTNKMSIPAGDTERLRAYARYPQGLPDVVRATLLQRVTGGASPP